MNKIPFDKDIWKKVVYMVSTICFEFLNPKFLFPLNVLSYMYYKNPETNLIEISIFDENC